MTFLLVALVFTHKINFKIQTISTNKITSMNQSSYTHPSFLEKLRLLRLHTMLEVGSLHCLDAINAMSTYNLDKIICIEPNPDCIALCRENIKNYKNISLIECAAWHEESSISFFPVVD